MWQAVENADEAVTVEGPITIEFWHTRSGDHGKLLDEQIKKFKGQIEITAEE